MYRFPPPFFPFRLHLTYQDILEKVLQWRALAQALNPDTDPDSATFPWNLNTFQADMLNSLDSFHLQKDFYVVEN